MENASKALIMAGAILIAILLISLSVLLFNNLGGTAKEMANMDEQEIAAFNAKITPYTGSAVTGSQVNALLQYCLSVNMSAHQSGATYKAIDVKGNNTLPATIIDKTDASISGFDRVATGGKTYKVEGTYDANGLITTITITPN